jgi:transcriptional regulator with XRE-family HTH domain
VKLQRRIRSWRQAAGLSQVDLAKKLGVTPSAVCLWETGKCDPGAHRFRAIARACGVTLKGVYCRSCGAPIEWLPRQKTRQAG